MWYSSKWNTKLFEKGGKKQTLTKSKAEPPPKYSIMIHSFVSCIEGENRTEAFNWFAVCQEKPNTLYWRTFYKAVKNERVLMTLLGVWESGGCLKSFEANPFFKCGINHRRKTGLEKKISSAHLDVAIQAKRGCI